MKGKGFIGKVFQSKMYGEYEVIEYLNYDNVVVRFLKTGYTTTTQLFHVKSGGIKDRLSPSVYGVGVVGEEKLSENGIKLKEYKVWRGMLARCYNSKCAARNKTYSECTVSQDFKYFPYFKDWCSRQIGFTNEGWELDKDIIIRGNKVYSEDTCCFVPPEINLLFGSSKAARGEHPIGVSESNSKTNRFSSSITKYGETAHLGLFNTPEEAFYAYKKAKEAYIKEVANRWKDKIDPRVYEALMNWEISIDD